MRTFLITIIIIQLYSCGKGKPPNIIYQKGDFWVDNFVNYNYPAKAFADDRIYCSSIIIGKDTANRFYCLNLRTGKVDWAVPVRSWAAQPPIICDSFIYYCSYVGDIYKFDKSGNQLWYLKFPSPYGGHSYNPLTKNLFVSTVDSGIREIDYQTGKIVDSIGYRIMHVPFPIFANDTIYQVIGDTISCRHVNDSYNWKIKVGENIDRLFKMNNRLYYVDDTKRMYCLNAKTGSTVWQSDTVFLKQPWGIHLEFEKRKLLCYFTDLNSVFVINNSSGSIEQKNDYKTLQKSGFLLPNTKQYIVSDMEKSYVVKVFNILDGASDLRNQFDISVEQTFYHH